MSKPSTYMTAKQAAKRLAISRDTLMRLIDAGHLPGTIQTTGKAKGHYRIPIAAVRAFEDAAQVK